MNATLVTLTCANKQEAQTITESLLNNQLAVCIKQQEVQSVFQWKDKFASIDEEVSKHHSYETFVLNELEITNQSHKAQLWMEGLR